MTADKTIASPRPTQVGCVSTFPAAAAEIGDETMMAAAEGPGSDCTHWPWPLFLLQSRWWEGTRFICKQDIFSVSCTNLWPKTRAQPGGKQWKVPFPTASICLLLVKAYVPSLLCFYF